MNKIVYVAPFLAAITLSHAASAQYKFSVPTFFTDVQSLTSSFNTLSQAVTNLSTETASTYTSSTTDATNPGSYAAQLGLYQATFDYCLPATGPSPCTSAEVATAMDGRAQLGTASSDLSSLPPASAVETSMGNLNSGVGGLETTDVTDLQSKLTSINNALIAAQADANQIIGSNSMAAEKAKAAASAMSSKAAPAKAATATKR